VYCSAENERDQLSLNAFPGTLFHPQCISGWVGSATDPNRKCFVRVGHDPGRMWSDLVL